mmetsp:Transcript_3283/g.6823  ORF Transcript_3283/g.6823 Transcript_3283/m.6823 type:complete len:86 (+) Transcript_3283:771-1028(+)
MRAWIKYEDVGGFSDSAGGEEAIYHGGGHHARSGEGDAEGSGGGRCIGFCAKHSTVCLKLLYANAAILCINSNKEYYRSRNNCDI